MKEGFAKREQNINTLPPSNVHGPEGHLSPFRLLLTQVILFIPSPLSPSFGHNSFYSQWPDNIPLHSRLWGVHWDDGECLLQSNHINHFTLNINSYKATVFMAAQKVEAAKCTVHRPMVLLTFSIPGHPHLDRDPSHLAIWEGQVSRSPPLV